MLHRRRRSSSTGRWVLLAVVALLLSGVGFVLVPGAGASNEGRGCGNGGPESGVRTSCPGDKTGCSGSDIDSHGDKVKGSDSADCDGKGEGNDNDADDNPACTDTATVDCDGKGTTNDNDADDNTSSSVTNNTTNETTNNTTINNPAAPTTTAPVQLVKGSTTTGRRPLACTSRRRFVIHVRHPRGQHIVSAVVTVNGKPAPTAKTNRVISTITLKGLPRGTARVHIVAVTNTGKVLRGTRTYHTCVRRIKHGPPKL